MSEPPIRKTAFRFLARCQHPTIYEGLTELLSVCAETNGDLGVVGVCDLSSDLQAWQALGIRYREALAAFPVRIPATFRLLAAGLRESLFNRHIILGGCDKIGGIIAAMAGLISGRRVLIYGLEFPSLLEEKMSLVDRLEHWSYRKAALIVTMDIHHARFIAENTGADMSKIVFLPVALRGPGRIGHSDLLRKNLNLGPSDRIVLHAGGIGQAQGSLDLADAASNWKPGVHLVFHAHCDMKQELYFRQFAERVTANGNVHLHDRPVAIDQLDDVVSGSDICVAWYNREVLGYRADLLGLAAGKIGRALRNGRPVIVPDLPTVREYVEKYQCGIVVRETGEIGAAIDRILADHTNYAQNALRCYEELWRPERYHDELRHRLGQLMARGRRV